MRLGSRQVPRGRGVRAAVCAALAARFVTAACAQDGLDRVAVPGQALDEERRYVVEDVKDARVNRYGDVVLHAMVRDTRSPAATARRTAVFRQREDGVFETAAVSGELAPPWYVFEAIADSRFTEFSKPVISDSGAVSFAAAIDSRQAGMTLWTAQAGEEPSMIGAISLYPLVRQEGGGWTSRDLQGQLATFDRIDAPAVSAGGTGVFAASVSHSAYDGRRGVWHYHADRYRYTIPAIARRPFPLVLDGLPGELGEATWEVVRVNTPLSVGGRFVLTATVRSQHSPGGGALRDGVWIVKDPAEGGQDVETELLVLGGAAVEGTGNRRLGEFGAPAANMRGQAAFTASLTGGTGEAGEAVVRAGLGRVEALAATGAAAPAWPRAAVFDRFLDPDMNASGAVVLAASVRRNNLAGVSDGMGVWMVDPAGGLGLAARSGEEAPGFPAGTEFASFGRPRLTDSGSIVLNATVRGAGLTALGGEDFGCWIWEKGSGLRLAARRGMQARDVRGTPHEVSAFTLADVSGTGVGLLQLRLAGGPAGLYRFLEPDATAPAAPQGLRASADSYDRVSVIWDPSTDERFVREYVVYRNGSEVGRSRKPSFDEQGFQGGESVRYEIAAADLRGNLSARSTPVSTRLPLRGAEIVVDDDHAVYVGSPWWAASNDTDVIGSNSFILQRNSSANYRPELPVSGRYAVYAWISGVSAAGTVERRDPTARYRIRHIQGEAEIVVDQNRYVGRWVWLGSYLFRLGEGAEVVVHRDEEVFHTVADAVRWVLLPADAQPPAAPSAVSARWEASERVRVRWGAVSDESEVINYRVYRDGKFLGETEELEFLDRGAEAGLQYAYTVEAIDFHGNRSAASAPATVALPSSGAEIVADDKEASEMWPGWWPLSGDTDAWAGESHIVPKHSTARWNAGLPARGLYEVWVWVSGRLPDGSLAERDRAAEYTIEHGGGVSEVVLDQSATIGRWAFLGTWEFGRGGGVVSVSRQSAGAETVADALRFVMLPDDTTAPEVPQGLSVVWESATRARLRWQPATDASEAVSYRIYRDGRFVGETESTSVVDLSAVPGARHSYRVEAVDFHGNSAGAGLAVSVSMPSRGIEKIVEETEAEWGDASRPLTSDVDSHGGSSRYLVEGSWAAWQPALPVSGFYEVSVWVSGRQTSGVLANRNPTATYRIDHAGGSASVRLDQNARLGAWAFLGSWRFDKAREAGVRVERGLGEGNTVADAVRFRLLLEENGANPTIPAGFMARWLAGDRVELKWNASSDDLDAVIYRIRRDGLEAGESDETVYVDSGLAAGTEYRYTVEAVDYHGTGSGPSGEAVVRTPQRGVVIEVEDTQAEYSGSPWWGVSNAADAHGANSYVLQKGSQATVSAVLPARAKYELWAWVSVRREDGSALLLDRNAEYEVQHAGGVSQIVLDQSASLGGWAWLGTWEFARGSEAAVTVFRQEDNRATVVDAFRWVMLPEDRQAPPQPPALSVAWESASRVWVSWQGVRDASESVAYRVYRDGTLLGTTEETVFVDDEASPGATHDYAVEAVDFHGNSAGPAGFRTVRLPTLGAEVVADDTVAQNLGPGGWTWGNLSDGYGGDARWVARDSGVRWQSALPVTGIYEVWAWLSGRGSDGVAVTRDGLADYEVEHAWGAQTVVVDQNAALGEWAYIGTWRFRKGNAGVTLRRQTSGRPTVADALRFRLLLEDNETAPSVPKGLSAVWLASDRAELRWEESMDDLDAVVYEILRNGQRVGRTSGTSYVDAGLEPGASYAYKVEAVDYHGVRSGASVAIDVVTPRLGQEFVADDVQAQNLGPAAWAWSLDEDAWDGGSRLVGRNSAVSWKAQLPARSRYEVWAWISGGRDDGTAAVRDPAADYEVTHAGGMSVMVVNQNAHVGRWAFLGTWLFGRGESSVVLARQNGNEGTAADAIRWVMLPDDDEAPSMPTGVTASWETSSSVRIRWNPASDASQAVTYRLYRDGVLLAETAATTLLDTGVAAGTHHTYAVEAVDYHGNRSGSGPPVEVRLPERGVEIVVEESAAEFSDSVRPLTEDTDAHGGASRSVSKDSSVRWNVDLPVSGAYSVWVWVSGKRADGSLALRDRAADYDVAHAGGTSRVIFDQNTNPGEWALLGTWRFVKGQASVTGWRQDTGAAFVADAVRFRLLLEKNATEPSVPGGLGARWLASDRVELQWEASTDDMDAVIYEVFRDGVALGSVSGESFVDEGLEAGARYAYEVEAVDYHGERSGRTSAVEVAMPEPGWESVVDDAAAVYSGNVWWGVSNASDAYGSNSYALQKNSHASLTPALPARAVYEVWAWISGTRSDGTLFTLDNEVEYDVRHLGGLETVVLDQSRFRGGWAWLGTWEFLRGSLGSVTVRRQDGNGAVVVDAFKWVMLPDDQTPPPTPGSPWVWWESASRTSMAWGPVEDASQWVRYRVRRDGLLAAETEETLWTDAAAEAGAEHRYSVAAVDFHGNVSAYSEEVAIRMPRRGQETVTDDVDAENLGPGWWASSNDADAYGGTSRLLAKGSSARWTAMLPRAGDYEVWVWISGQQAGGGVATRDRAADYVVEHGGGAAAVVLDQSAVVGQWAWLGSWQFPRGSAKITVSRQSAGSGTVVDAVKWVFIEPASMEGEVELAVDQAFPGESVNVVFRLPSSLQGKEVVAFRLRTLEGIAAQAVAVALGGGEWNLRLAIPAGSATGLFDVEIVFSQGDALRIPLAFAVGDLSGDADGDGVPTLAELLFGTDASGATGVLQQRMPVLRLSAEGEAEISWVRRVGAVAVGAVESGRTGRRLRYGWEATGDAGDGAWVDAEAFAAGPEEVEDRGDGTERVRQRFRFPVGWNGAAWLRMRVAWR